MLNVGLITITVSKMTSRCTDERRVRKPGAWVEVAALHLSSFNSGHVFTPQFFYSLLDYCYIFYRFIVKRLRPLFVGGAVQIHFD